MTVQTLNHLSIKEITGLFNLAFSDYAIPFQLTAGAKAQRLIKSRVDLSFSVGVFDKNQPVAFILAGTGQWHGHKNIYNAGTGVIPAYRNQRLVKKMYDYATPLWLQAGFTHTSLEVLVGNTFAIKAYESAGLKIVDRLIGYHGPLSKNGLTDGLILIEKNFPDWNNYKRLQTFDYSWDFCRDGVEAVLDTIHFYELSDHTGDLLGFAMINSNGQIAQAGAKTTKDWSLLLNALGTKYEKLKWINIQENQTDLLKTLQSHGWVKLVEQFEMRGKLVG